MTWSRRLLWLAFAPVLFLFCFVYGFFFALTAPYLIVQCALPILVLILLSIWALPDERVAPTRLMQALFAGYLISLCLWPIYLAVSLPGLPWLSPQRLFGVPLGFCLLVSLSISRRFRRQIGAILSATPIVWKAFAIFTVMQFITLPFSGGLAASLNRVLIQQINWTTMFIFSAYLFSKPGRITRYTGLMCAAIAPVFIVGSLEYQNQALLWAEHVPSFLAVENIDQVIKSDFRTGTGEYRAKAMFSTPLGLAEFIAILSPILFYYAHLGRKISTKISAVALLAMGYACIEYSGSRLGLVGMGWSFLLYVFMQAFIRWRRLRHDLIAPAIFYSYPAFFIAVLGASFTVTSVHNAVWGGGEHAASNQARMNQISMAMPSVLKNPIGYGAGESGPQMGYAPGQFVTIDNYLISLVLDYGVVGLGAYLTMFIAASSYAFRTAVLHGQNSRDPEAGFLIPLGVAVSAFIVIKVVFSQQDLDPLLFVATGMVVALVERVRRAQAVEAAPARSSTAAASPPTRRPATVYARVIQMGSNDKPR